MAHRAIACPEGTRYYRNVGSVVYHEPASNWMRTGKARCGRDLSNPGFVYTPGMDHKIRAICGDCQRLA